MTILLNLLKNYGGYALILAAAGGWFLWHDHREIDKGEARVVAAQKAADLKEAAHVAKVEADAKAKTDALQTQLDAALLEPVPRPGVTVRMCNHPSVPTDGGGSPPGARPPGDAAAGSSGAVGGGGQEGSDIAPMTEKILSDDKAIILYLQGYVASCQAAGLCAK